MKITGMKLAAKLLCLIMTGNLFLISCSGAVTQPAKTFEKSKTWTIMVYMAADNNLEGDAIDDINEMENAAFDDSIRVVALLDRSESFDKSNGDWSDTRFLEIQRDPQQSDLLVSKRVSCTALGISVSENTELNMANPKTLRTFVEYTKETYESDCYALIIWGHGNGWRYDDNKKTLLTEKPETRSFAYDEGNVSYMNVIDLGEALSGLSLDCIAFDTCFGAVFECFYQIKDCSTYLMGSPDSISSKGMNYTRLLESFSNSSYEPLDFCSSVLRSSPYEATWVKSDSLTNLKDSLDSFGETLGRAIDKKEVQLKLFNCFTSTIKGWQAPSAPCDLYLDLYSIGNWFSDDKNCAELGLSMEQAAVVSEKASELRNQLLFAGDSNRGNRADIGVLFGEINQEKVLSTVHSDSYIKGKINNQCLFVQESCGWVPAKNHDSVSVLDKLFYTSFS